MIASASHHSRPSGFALVGRCSARRPRSSARSRPARRMPASSARRSRRRISPSCARPSRRAPAPANGSIFQASDGYAALYEGWRARRVGDPLTIVLVERTAASKSSGSKLDSKGSGSITPPTTGPLTLFNSTDVGASGNRGFNGHGHGRPGQFAVGRGLGDRRRSLSQRHDAGAGAEARDAQPRRRIRPDQGHRPHRRYRRATTASCRPASPMRRSPIPARATSPAPAGRAGSAASSPSSARSDGRLTI